MQETFDTQNRSNSAALFLRSVQGDLHNAQASLDEALENLRRGWVAEFRFNLLKVGDLLAQGQKKVEEIFKQT